MESKAAAEAEANCLRQIARGDRAAFEALYRVWQPRLFRYLARFLDDPAAAEELCDDVLFEVWKSAGKFRQDSKVSTWIFGIAHHKAVSHLRKARVDTEAIDEMRPFADTGPGPERLLLEAAGRPAIHDALQRLTPAHREIIWLTFFEDMSYREIAHVAGCPEYTVKTRVSYAKRSLHQLLAGENQGGSGL